MAQDIDLFISQKRKEKQSDEMILQELLAVGWDRNLILQKLGGTDIPKPAAGNIPTSQTGGPGTPIQVENVQYEVKVGRVRSKVGFAAFVMAILVWLIAGIIMGLLLVLRERLIPLAGDNPIDASGIVLFISFLIPLVPLLWYTLIQLKKIIAANPAATDDIFFKKTIRFHLFVSGLIAVAWIGIEVFNILSKLFLPKENITMTAVLDGFIFALVFGALPFIFLHYQKLTKR